MAIDAGWYQDKRIVFGHFVGDLSTEDLINWGKLAESYIEAGIAPVHLVVDIRQMGKFPQQVTLLMSALTYLRNPKLGWNVIVGTSMIVGVLAQIVASITSTKYRNAPSLEDALDYLQRVDSTLAGS
jgi:hypothetical protein